MLILTFRTDKPEAEIGLYDSQTRLSYEIWPAHRALAETIHLKIKKALDKENKTFKDLEGVLIYKGPGSFTGLRIGFSVANALSDSLHAPIIAAAGEGWIETGVARLLEGENQKVATPDYGSEPKTTMPTK